MKLYEVTARALVLRAGRIQLTPEQVKHRGHALRAVPGQKDVFEITGEITFKSGEKIGYDGVLAKETVGQEKMLAPESAQARRDAQAKAEAEAAAKAKAKAGSKSAGAGSEAKGK